jgi:predicted ATP-dependent serine protease
MQYFCKDCSYRGNLSGQDGACPACGSFKVSRESNEPTGSTQAAGRWRMTLLVTLWTWLIVMVAWKLA